MAIEALLAGICPITLPTGQPPGNSLTGFSNSLSLQPKNGSELLKIVSRLTAGNLPEMQHLLSRLETRFAVSGDPAYTRVVHEWANLMKGQHRRLVGQEVWELRRAIKRGSKRISEKSRSESSSGLESAGRAKFPTLTDVGLTSRLQKLASSTGIRIPKVELISGHAVLMRPL